MFVTDMGWSKRCVTRCVTRKRCLKSMTYLTFVTQNALLRRFSGFAKMRFYTDFVQVLLSSTLQTKAKSKLINIEYERAL